MPWNLSVLSQAWNKVQTEYILIWEGRKGRLRVRLRRGSPLYVCIFLLGSHPTSAQLMGHPSGMFCFSLSTLMSAKTFPRNNRRECPPKRGKYRLFPKNPDGLQWLLTVAKSKCSIISYLSHLPWVLGCPRHNLESQDTALQMWKRVDSTRLFLPSLFYLLLRPWALSESLPRRLSSQEMGWGRGGDSTIIVLRQRQRKTRQKGESRRGQNAEPHL